MELEATAPTSGGKPDGSPYLRDILASIVVFLVALPLCMGIAMASGMPAANGIVTGIVGGLIVSTIGGCPLQVSGPAAGLAVIVFELIEQHGLEKLAVIIVIAGAIQLVCGLAGLAQWFRAVPPSVIHGMLSGIGLLIAASQFHVMVDDKPRASGVANLLSIPESVYKGLFGAPGSSHQEAAALGVLTIAILVLWQQFASPKLKMLPGALVAIVIATATSVWLHAPVKCVNLPNSLLDALHIIPGSALGSFLDRGLWLEGLTVAFIASAETLLTAAALDKMHSGPRTKYDRELCAQGVGNIICGFVGALPMTGVMVRSGVNVTAGARSRLSGIMHGVWLLTFVSLLPSLVRLIPTSALAALLVFTGYKLINWKIVKELKKFGRTEVAIWAATIIAMVGVDLLTGIVVGVVLTIVKLLYTFSHLEIKVADNHETNRTDIWLKGSATFLSLPRFADALESVRPDCDLHIHLEALDYIDHACLDLLMGWDKQHQNKGGNMVIDWSTLGAVFKDRRRRSRAGSATREFRKSLADRDKGKERPVDKEAYTTKVTDELPTKLTEEMRKKYASTNDESSTQIKRHDQ